jgi:hypothetical protein
MKKKADYYLAVRDSKTGKQVFSAAIISSWEKLKKKLERCF